MPTTRQEDEDSEREDLFEEEKTDRPGPHVPRRRRRKRTPRSGDVFLVVLLFGLVLLFVSLQPYGLIDVLYNPVAGLILLVIVVEYLILKSMDRTRIYQLENQRLREYRRGDRALLKRTREVLTENLQLDEETPEEIRRRCRARTEVLLDDVRDRL